MGMISSARGGDERCRRYTILIGVLKDDYKREWVSQDYAKCRAFVNTAINRRVLALNLLVSLNNCQLLEETPSSSS
jgi:hypothetical protein